MPPVLALHLVTFFFFLAYGLALPVLPLYLKALGLGSQAIGLAVALMPLAGLLLRPWGGHAADAWSRKKPAAIGLLASALAGLCYLGRLPLVLVGRLFQGAGMALFAPSTLAHTSDLAPREALGRVMGTRNLLIGLGVMLGTALGGFLVDRFGPRPVFLLILLVQLPWLPLLLSLPEGLEAPAGGRWWEGFLRALAIADVRAATVANAGFATVFATLQAFYPIYLVHRGFPASWVGGFFAYYSLISVFARMPAGALVDRYDSARVAVYGFAAASAGFFLLWLFPTPWPAFLGGTLMGAGAGVYLPANIVTVTRATPPGLRGAAFSLFTASWDAGGLVGPPLAGVLVATAGDAALFPFAALGALLTTLAYLALLPSR